MPISTRKATGEPVIYLGDPLRGSDHDQQAARNAGLIEGETYHLQSVDVWGFGSDCVLRELPDKSFNTVLFDGIPACYFGKFTGKGR